MDIFLNSNFFNLFELLVILANTLVIFISKPTDRNNLHSLTNYAFFSFYLLEAILKILTKGLTHEESSYFVDTWNTFTFVIILIAMLEIILGRYLINLIGFSIGILSMMFLRLLNIMQRAKIKNDTIEEILSITKSFLYGFSKLNMITIVMFIVFYITSVIGLQMFSGKFLMRCMNLESGYFYDFGNFMGMCTESSQCDWISKNMNTQFICTKSQVNPDHNFLNFDNILKCFIIIFQLLSGQGITVIYNYLSRTFYDTYQILRIIKDIYIFGSSYILILVVFFYIAVLKTIFSEEERNLRSGNKSKLNFAYYILNKKYSDEQVMKDIPEEDVDEADRFNHLDDFVITEEEEDIDVMVKDINCIPLNLNSCSDLKHIQSLKPKKREALLEEIKFRSFKKSKAEKDEEEKKRRERKKRLLESKKTEQEKNFKEPESFKEADTDEFNKLLSVSKKKVMKMFEQMNSNFEAIVMCNPIFKLMQSDINDVDNAYPDQELADEIEQSFASQIGDYNYFQNKDEYNNCLASNNEELDNLPSIFDFAKTFQIGKSVENSNKYRKVRDSLYINDKARKAKEDVLADKKYSFKTKRKNSISIRNYIFDITEANKWRERKKKKRIDLKYDLIKYKRDFRQNYKYLYNLIGTNFSIANDAFKIKNENDSSVLR